MCVTYFMFDSLEDFALLLAFNRDETYDRRVQTRLVRAEQASAE